MTPEMDNAFRNRQEEQLQRFSAWAGQQGTLELPTSLATMLTDRQKLRMDWLKQHRVDKTLEVGCNIGVVMAWTGADVGVDVNPMNVVLARLLVPGKRFEVADARDLSIFADMEFASVMLPEVLEHLIFEDVEPALREAVRVASRRVLITFPDGREDTEEATCFKHRWLGDEQAVGAIVRNLRRLGARVAVERLQGFICMNAQLVG